MKSCRILALGGAGYIGGTTVDTLCDNSHTVKVVDNLLYEDRYLKPVDFQVADICNTKEVVELAEGYDVVVLLAALVGDPACNVRPELTEKINYKAVKDLCEHLPKDKHVVFASTCSVYGANDELVDEDGATNPLSAYASTKLRAEKHVLGRGGTVFRLGTVYGVGDLFSRLRTDLVVNTLTVKAFTQGEITVNGGGQWRPIISSKDVGGYIEEACRTRPEGIFNLCYKNVQIKDLVDDILSVMPETKVNTIDQMYQDNRNYKVNCEKALNTFEFKPKITVQEEVIRLHSLLKFGRVKNPENEIYNNGQYLLKRL